MPGEPTILSLVAAMLRRRRLFILLPMLFGITPVVVGLSRDRTWTATTKFATGTESGSLSTLIGAAAQLGLPIASSSSSDSPDFYAEYLDSDAIMEALVQAPYFIGKDSARVWLPDSLGVSGSSDSEKVAKAALRLNNRFWTISNPGTGTVQISAKFWSPLVAMAVVDRALDMVQEFNREKRQSQARSEREFAEERLKAASAELRESEGEMATFLERNRDFRGSPRLAFENDRLQRLVSIRQDVVATLARAVEQARIEEVRSTPVITIVEATHVSGLPDRRGLLFKLILGTFVGLILATAATVVLELVAHARELDTVTGEQLDTAWKQTVAEISRWFPKRRRNNVEDKE